MMAVFFPYNTGGNHWALAVVWGGKRRIDYYDSMFSKASAMLCFQVQKFG